MENSSPVSISAPDSLTPYTTTASMAAAVSSSNSVAVRYSSSTSTTTPPNDINYSHYFSPSNIYSRYPVLPHEHQALQFPAANAGALAYRPHVVVANNNNSVIIPQPPHAVLTKEQERRLFDAWTTKVARTKRRLARQRSLNFPRNYFHSASSTATTTAGASTAAAPGDASPLLGGNSGGGLNRDLYTFSTPDKKRLRVLLKKELKNSDVGSLGRIVLPKREAEEKLPTLSDKEGIQVVIREVYSNQEWSLRYKYWSNNKSRMYVLENTGDFVKQNGLEIGDSITLYEDECKNLYVSIKKGDHKREPAAETSPKRHLTNNGNTSSTTADDNTNSTTSFNNDIISITTINNKNNSKSSSYENLLYASYAACELDSCRVDEEDVSLALLIEQLNQKEQQEANNLVTTLMSTTTSHVEEYYYSSNSYGHLNVVVDDINSSISYDSHNTGQGTTSFLFSSSSSSSSSTQPTIAPVGPPPPRPPSPSWGINEVKVEGVQDHHFDDCYGGLGTLPEVDGRYEYYNYATLFDRINMGDK